MGTEPDEAETLHKAMVDVEFDRAIDGAQSECPVKVQKYLSEMLGAGHGDKAETLVSTLQDIFNGGKSGRMTVKGDTCQVVYPVHTDPQTGGPGEGTSRAGRALSEMLAVINNDQGVPFIQLHSDGPGPNEVTLTFTKQQLLTANAQSSRGMETVVRAAGIDDRSRSFVSEAGAQR